MVKMTIDDLDFMLPTIYANNELVKQSGSNVATSIGTIGSM